MKYILTENEYNNLINKVDHITKMYIQDVQKLCIEVAIHKPIYLFGKDQPHITWGCIQANNEEQRAECCDECPVENICPHNEKIWSK